MRTCLIDLSGVVYNESGIIPGVVDVFKTLQKDKQVLIATNNSNINRAKISRKLSEKGIQVPEEHILSSGLGLTEDPDIQSQIKNKSIYLYGRPSAIPYFENTTIKGLVENVDQAEVIVMMASLGDQNETIYQQVKTSLLKHKRPIIACNPDRYVMGNTEKIKVAGYYAEKLGNECDIKVKWFGKPYMNFSKMVANKCKQLGVGPVDKNSWFFDDNLENLVNMKHHLGLSICCIKETGLSKYVDIPSELKRLEGTLDATIPSLSFSEQIS